MNLSVVYFTTFKAIFTNIKTIIMEPTNFFLDHWVELLIGLMAFVKIVVNLTPTESDNQIFGYLDVLITAITGDRRKRRD